MSHRNPSATPERTAGVKIGVAVFVVGFIAFAAERTVLHGSNAPGVEPTPPTRQAPAAPYYYYLPDEFAAPAGDAEPHVDAF